MITFTDARKAAWSRAFAALDVLPYVAEDGWEDRTHYLVTMDSLAWVHTGDPTTLLTDPPAYLVAKADGGVTELGWEAGQLRSGNMRPVRG